ncbi:pantoate--beta-alanine ligase [Lachnospiraceae bacterium C10]|nr:pantoate--beta-alanine ligase [Lachnospiraceae bacterium C10]
MIKATTVEQVKKYVRECKKKGKSIGLVPTMGFLHEGHASLMKRARKENDIVIVSDFVNPTQFGPNEDLEAYPRDFDADCKLCESIGVDLIFHPTPEEMYGEKNFSKVHVDKLTEGLCGAVRPVHFDGVCTVVTKLFNISRADRAYFGQKDAQQLAVVSRMVKDLNYNIEIIGCPIIREEDGLAKSSRNTYLDEEQRKAAVILHKALSMAEQKALDGETDAALLCKEIAEVIEQEPLAKIDYVEAVDWDELSHTDVIDGKTLFAIAVYIGKVRLIDNFIIG